ncbi:hypothetical protein B0H14DRAFT_2647108 [Mycena olivaceomarginata]|nr:hypothetical protein B0H14DRAFT_2647108 [Mycena olivaceomarginata]
MAAAGMPSPIPKADWAHWKVARCLKNAGNLSKGRRNVEKGNAMGVHSPQQNQIDCPFLPATMVELAQELIDVIIKHTATENKDSSCSGTRWRPTDRSTLTACARVTHAFLVPSQRCLFQSPEIEFNRQRIMCAVFAQNSILTSYVQDLMIDLDFADNSTLTLLAPILPMFQEVRRLTIQTKAHGELKKLGHHGNGPAQGITGWEAREGKERTSWNIGRIGANRVLNVRREDRILSKYREHNSLAVEFDLWRLEKTPLARHQKCAVKVERSCANSTMVAHFDSRGALQKGAYSSSMAFRAKVLLSGNAGLKKYNGKNLRDLGNHMSREHHPFFGTLFVSGPVTRAG